MLSSLPHIRSLARHWANMHTTSLDFQLQNESNEPLEPGIGSIEDNQDSLPFRLALVVCSLCAIFRETTYGAGERRDLHMVTCLCLVLRSPGKLFQGTRFLAEVCSMCLDCSSSFGLRVSAERSGIVTSWCGRTLWCASLSSKGWKPLFRSFAVQQKDSLVPSAPSPPFSFSVLPLLLFPGLKKAYVTSLHGHLAFHYPHCGTEKVYIKFFCHQTYYLAQTHL